MFRKTILIAIISFFSVYTYGAKWENYTDMKNIISISPVPGTNLAYCASNGGIFLTDISTGNILGKYTTINGLLSNDITAAIIDNNNRLWVGAADGSISILNLSNNSWKYIYDIRNSNEANKGVYGFTLYNSFIYIATGYGIQKVSTSTFNFVDAPYYQLGVINPKTKVFSLCILNNSLYAATASGIAYAYIINSNLNDPNKWSNFISAPLNTNVITITGYDNKIFAGSGTGFWYFDGTIWSAYPNSGVSSTACTYAKVISNKLYFISGNKVFFASAQDLANITQFQGTGNYTTLAEDYLYNAILGTSDKGISANVSNNYRFVFPNGPFKNSFDQITIDTDGNLWAAGGDLNAGFYKFDGSTWTNYLTSTNPEIGTSNFFRRIFSGGNTVWALSYGGGAVMIQNGVVMKFYSPANSTLPGIPADPLYCTPFGGAIDNVGNTWFSFYVTNTSSSLYAFTGDSNMTGIPNPSMIGTPNLEDIAIDSYNTKWIVSGESSPRGLYYFNENNGAYIYGFYNLNDFSVDDVTDVIVDRNNEIWISTNNGVFIISNPLGAIQNPNSKPIPQKLGIISGNLKVPFTENCKTITVDILNQKWIGTQNNGVFHLSDDGSTLLEQFNTTNSPLLSNSVNTIEVSKKNGVAYIGTLKGLSAYQTNAIEPLAEFDKIICSPNPYLVPANVDLKIDGLIENSSVKIITLSGEVINEFLSPGGKIATWDGRDKKGNIIPSGIYIVVAYNKDGSKVGKGKLAVVKR